MRRFLLLSLAILLAAAVLTSACQSRPSPTPAPATPNASATPVAPATPLSTRSPASPTAPATGLAPGGTLTIALDFLGEEAVDPGLAGSSKLYLELMFDQIISANKEGTAFDPERSVLSKWVRSADGRTWTFDVRQGIKFHDGSPLTAEDVKFTLQRVIDPTSKYTNAGTIKGLIESVSVTGPYQLVVNTKPNFALPYDISDFLGTEGMVLPKAYVEKNGIDYFRDHPVGSGPYRLLKHTPGEFVFEALPEHWAIGIPKYKTIIFKSVPEESTKVAMLKRNEADIISVTTDKSEQLKNDGFSIFEQKDSALTWAILHQQWHDKTPFKDVRVREALNIAINRDEIVKYIFRGRARPESNVVHSWSIGYEKLPPFPYDPQRAKQLLKDAGYASGFTVNYNWFPFRSVPEQKQVAEAVAGYWEAIGVKANMAQMEWGAYFNKWRQADFPDPAAGMGVLDARVFSGPNVSLEFHSKGLLTLVSDPKLDAMMESATAAVDQATAETKLAEAARYIKANFMAVPLVSVSSNIATGPKVKDWRFGRIALSISVRNNVGSK